MKKRFVCLLSLLMVLFAVLPFAASAADEAHVEAGDKLYFKVSPTGFTSSVDTNVNLMWLDQDPGNNYIDKHNLTPQRDGKIWTYCINHGAAYGHPFRETEDLLHSVYWLSLSDIAQTGIKLATIYGYPAKSASELGVSDLKWAYMATQAIIWEYQQGYRTSADSLNNPAEYNAFIKGNEAEIAYNKILDGIRNHYEGASFRNTTITLKYNAATGKYEASITDTKGLLSGYTVTSTDSRIAASVSGNTLRLESSVPVEGDVPLRFDRQLPPLSQHGIFVGIGRNPGDQEIITGVADDPYFFSAMARVESFGNLQIKKTSEDGVVSGIPFRVTGQGIDRTVTTGAGGTISLPDLLPGTYTVTEQTPDKYNAQQSQTVTVVSGQTATVSFHNTLRRGGLKIIKTFEGLEIPIAGVPFRVTGPNGYNQQYTTDANGEIQIDGLLPGTYTATELYSDLTKAYVLSPEQTVVVTADQTAQLKIHNQLKKGYVELYKTESVNNRPLPGAVFGIYNAADERIGQLTTNAQGYAKSGLIEYGTGYYLLEESAPSGWLVDNTKHYFDITENGATITITAKDAPDLGRLEVYKTGEVLVGADFRQTEHGLIFAPIYESRYLPGATIQLYAAQDIIVNGVVMFEAGELVDTQVTTATGPAVFEGLYPGSYLYRESLAPQGFFVGTNEGQVQIGPGIKDIITLHNERQKAKIVFWKTWEENPVYPNPDAWQDMSFGLFAAEDVLDIDGNVVIEAGSLVDVAGIDQDGQGAFTVDLPVGFKGFVRELTTADGYILDETEYPVVFDRPDQTVPFVRIDVNDGEALVNKVVYGSVGLQKMSKLPEDAVAQGFKNRPLAGAVYGIYTMDGQLLLALNPTDENGFAAAPPNSIPYGRYYLQEITPPEFFELDTNRYEFTVGMEQGEDGSPIVDVQLTVENKPIIGQIVSNYVPEIEEGQDYNPATGDSPAALIGAAVVALLSILVLFGLGKKRKKGASAALLALLLMVTPLSALAEPSAPADEITRSAEFTADSPDAEYTGFEETVTENGVEYRLDDVTYTVLSEEKLTEQQTITHEMKSEPMYTQGMEPEQTVTVDGIVYTLKDVVYAPASVTNRRVEVSAYTQWPDVVVAPVPSDKKTASYRDEATGRTETVELPLVGLEQVTELEWRTNKELPITVEVYNADLYKIGDRYAPYNPEKPALQGYEADILEMLGLDTALHTIDDISWAGEPYTKDGVLCRDAVATGRKYCATYRAEYADTIQLADAPGYQGTAIYEAEQTVETGKSAYKLQAAAVYKAVSVESGIPIVPLIVGISVGVLVLALLIVAILYVLAKKKKRRAADPQR